MKTEHLEELDRLIELNGIAEISMLVAAIAVSQSKPIDWDGTTLLLSSFAFNGVDYELDVSINRLGEDSENGYLS